MFALFALQILEFWKRVSVLLICANSEETIILFSDCCLLIASIPLQDEWIMNMVDIFLPRLHHRVLAALPFATSDFLLAGSHRNLIASGICPLLYTKNSIFLFDYEYIRCFVFFLGERNYLILLTLRSLLVYSSIFRLLISEKYDNTQICAQRSF